MARRKIASLLGAFIYSIAVANGSSTTLTKSPSSTTATNHGTTSPPYSGLPISLWSLADSLISEYYPSTTLHGFKTLSWPSTIVIGGTTYTLHPSVTKHHTKPTNKATSKATPKSHGKHAAATPSQTTTKVSADSNHDQKGDQRLAIIIGVVIGIAAFAIVGVLFYCLYRRRRDNGSFFLGRRTPSTISTGSRRNGHPNAARFRPTPDVYTGYGDHGNPKYVETSVIERGQTPPIGAHPAYVHHSSRSTSDEENPFYTPDDLSTAQLHHYELDGTQKVELEHDEPAHRRSSSSIRNSRPPTPFSPVMMMMQKPGPSAQPQIHQNPFASPEDAEADDIVSPILPTRPAERRYSPIVHYPSWDEVSEFNFSGDERDGPSEDGGDGWRPERERRDGRYELA